MSHQIWSDLFNHNIVKRIRNPHERLVGNKTQGSGVLLVTPLGVHLYTFSNSKFIII